MHSPRDQQSPSTGRDSSSSSQAVQLKPASGSRGGAALQLKAGLHGLDFAAQESMLAPVQRKRSGDSARTGAVADVVQRRTIDPNQGITGGKTSFGDFAGDVTEEDKDKATADTEKENDKSLDELAIALQKAVGQPAGTFDGRSEEEMFAAIAAETAPRYLARVGNAAFMQPGGRFGGGKDGSKPFVFATEPADLMGCKPIEALLKVGWKLEQMQGNVTKMIGVCIFDTQKAVPKADGSGAGTVDVGKMEWPELITMAKGDGKFKSTLVGKGVDYGRLDEGFQVCVDTPVEAAPQTSDPALKALCVAIRETMYELYGASSLYSGVGMTVQESGQAGAREVMVKNNGTNFLLTADNHRTVEIGVLTQADLDAAKAALGV